MAPLLLLRYSFPFLLFLVSSVIFVAKPISSFSLKRFDTNPNFDPNITVFGDAQIVDGGSCVKITQASIFSAGRLIYKPPIKFVEAKSSKPLSFSTYFEFSISSENGNGDNGNGNGDGLAFVVLPSGFPLGELDGHSFGLSPGLERRKDGVLAVEFNTAKNQVGINIGSLVSAKVSNISSINLVLNTGNRLHSWIDYEASSKRLEVRLSDSSNRPYDPLLSYQIDLAEMWKGEDMFVGISSSNGNSTQSSNIYSWSFSLRHVPTWFHSQPLDPHYSLHNKPEIIHERSVCISKILAALMFGVGCGALMVFIVYFMRAVFASKHAVVVPTEYPVHPMEFGYEKIKIVVEKVEKVAPDAKKVEA